MKKILVGFFAVVLLALFVAPSFAANYDYTATVYKRTGNTGANDLTEITTGIQFQVLDVDTNTAATITRFGVNAGTAVTNPVTAANFASATVCAGKVKFRNTAATVDIIVTHNTGGYTTVVRGFSPNMHTIIIDEQIGVVHHGMVPYASNDNVATDTGVDFPVGTLILDVWVEQVTVDNSETLNVGTADTAAGFRTALALATGAEGLTADTGVITAGSTLDYYAATNYGTLLTTAITGGDALDTGGGNSRKPHYVKTAGTDDDLYYTETAGGDTAAGYIHYMFIRLR
jgi:hypothetical protein